MADCRFCAAPLRLTFADLATSPLANSFLSEEQLRQGETFYPLHAYVCEQCFLVQLEEFETPEGIFSDYVYFSSVSTSWVEHARALRGGGDPALRARRPRARSSRSPATTATCCSGSSRPACRCSGSSRPRTWPRSREEHGIPSLVEFFGTELATRLADERPRPDLIIGNNVLAHVPDINDFVEGLGVLLAPGGDDHDRVPAPAAADRGDAVRHDLPRALLVPLAGGGRPGLRRARPAALRRRGAADPRRVAADLRLPRGRAARDDRAAGRAARARGRLRAARARDLHLVRRARARAEAGAARASCSRRAPRARPSRPTARPPRA